jgi:hypothetical protein
VGGRDEVERPRAQDPQVAGLGDELLHHTRELDRVALARGAERLAARRVHHHERRPGADGVAVPGDALGIVEHGVLDAHAGHRGLHGRVLGLARELRRVDPDHHELAREAALEAAQLLHHVLAVHARLREEVQQDDAAAQGGERQDVHPDPAPGALELGARMRTGGMR